MFSKESCHFRRKEVLPTLVNKTGVEGGYGKRRQSDRERKNSRKRMTEKER